MASSLIHLPSRRLRPPLVPPLPLPHALAAVTGAPHMVSRSSLQWPFSKSIASSAYAVGGFLTDSSGEWVTGTLAPKPVVRALSGCCLVTVAVPLREICYFDTAIVVVSLF
jgi:hypothetical protein